MIQSKPKPCKGVNLAKGHGCGKYTIHRKYGLGKFCCYPEWLLNSENGKIKLAKARLSAQRQIKKSEKTEKKEMREAVTDYKAKLQDLINKIAREVDLGQDCTARQIKCKTAHGGHVFARGSWTSMRYNLHNIWIQSAHSDTYQNDDGLMRDGIERIGGPEYLKFVTGLKLTPPLKFKDWEYQELYKNACKVYREMEKGKVRSNEERISMRNEINLQLGIYPMELCLFSDDVLAVPNP